MEDAYCFGACFTFKLLKQIKQEMLLWFAQKLFVVKRKPQGNKQKHLLQNKYRVFQFFISKCGQGLRFALTWSLQFNNWCLGTVEEVLQDFCEIWRDQILLAKRLKSS